MDMVLCTRYNNNGDYSGFLFLNEGTQLAQRDIDKLSEIAETFYQDTNVELEKVFQTSIGEIKLSGRINQQIERRKVVEGFLNSSTIPALGRSRTSSSDKRENVTLDTFKWKEQVVVLLDQWVAYLKSSDINIDDELEAVLKIVFLEIRKPTCQINPAIMLPMVLRGLLKGRNENHSSLHLIDYLESRLIGEP